MTQSKITSINSLKCPKEYAYGLKTYEGKWLHFAPVYIIADIHFFPLALVETPQSTNCKNVLIIIDRFSFLMENLC